MSMDIIDQLRCIEKGRPVAQAAAEEIRKLRAELAASRHELENAKKAADAQARLIDSLEQQRAHLNAQRDQWVEARDTLDSERAANAVLTEELAASREREARMRALLGFLLIVARTADDAMPETHARIVSEAEAALDEGAQPKQPLDLVAQTREARKGGAA